MAKVAFTAPGMTIAEVEAAVGRAQGWASTDTDWSTNLAKIDQAITAAGQAIATWNAVPWWWLETVGAFATVDGQAEYTLRTVSSVATPPVPNAMADLRLVNHGGMLAVSRVRLTHRAPPGPTEKR